MFLLDLNPLIDIFEELIENSELCWSHTFSLHELLALALECGFQPWQLFEEKREEMCI